MTRVLVTGGAGFVGSHIIDRLVGASYDVTVRDNLTDQVHDDKPAYCNDDAEYVWGDVRDRELVTDLLADIDILNHQAGAVGVGQSMYEIERYVDTNTLGTACLLDIVVNEEIDLDRMVVASSMSILIQRENSGLKAGSESRKPDSTVHARLPAGYSTFTLVRKPLCSQPVTGYVW